MQSVAKGSSDLIEGLPNDNNEVDHYDVNEIINGANTNVSVDKVANDVQTIARFLLVNDAENAMLYDEVLKALEDNKAEIAELKARVADLEAQMRSELND